MVMTMSIQTKALLRNLRISRQAMRYGRAINAIGIVSIPTVVGTTTGATEVIHSQAGLRAPAELRAPAATR
jgi:hypothetical protein